MIYTNSNKMYSIIYIIGIIVIILFAIAFILLASLYFKSKKINIENGNEDEQIIKDIKKDFLKFYDKQNKIDGKSIKEDFNKKQKTDKAVNNVLNIFFIILFSALAVLSAFSISAKMSGGQFFIANQASLVIQTSSMETAYKGNTYLFDENGKEIENQRISQYAFITISNKQEYIDNLQAYDIVAFKMKNGENNYITVIHRLIDISLNDNGENVYTFRGDANASSMAGEFKISKDMIIGVYQSVDYKGAYNVAFGYLIQYLQSPIGLIVVLVAFCLILIYQILNDKIMNYYEKRYLFLFDKVITEIDDYILKKKDNLLIDEGVNDEKN